MELKKYILQDENIYLAIYSVRSYVFDPQLLKKEDKKLLNDLADPFNNDVIDKTIKDVKKELKKILEDENYFFETKVYYKPKDHDSEKPYYRPIHTAQLKQLIAMVALMHPLIYEVPNEGNNWRLNLSNYSRLIPKNFYGNRVSKEPEELFKKWNDQYKEYTKRANEYLKTFRETKEYQYELKLDLKNFFPSVDPRVVYGILLKYMPVSFNERDKNVLKTIIYKLLVCEVTNLNTETAKSLYYGGADIDKISKTYTKGIAQGLPQSYFFGNICMMIIAKVFDQYYNGKSVYYVDDSYIYTNKEIEEDKFISQIEEINKEIKEQVKKYISMVQNGPFLNFISKKDSIYRESLEQKEVDDFYNIQVHTDGKSSFTKISGVKDGEIYLRNLSREASQIGMQMNSTYSEEEDETIFHKTTELVKAIDREIKKMKRDGGQEAYIEKLERYKKFFSYRQMRLQLKVDKDINDSIFKVLTGEKYETNSEENRYNVLSQGIEQKEFFQLYKHDIWQAALSLLIANTESKHEVEKIKQYIKKVIDNINLNKTNDLQDCNYIKVAYSDYLDGDEIQSEIDCYATLNKMVNRKMNRYTNMNSNALKEKFTYTKIKGLKPDILDSFGICSSVFVKKSMIVNKNSSRLQRMVLNAIYSKVFKVTLSDDIALNSYNKKGISYGELRALAYLRNTRCSISDFLDWKLDVIGNENQQKIDYTIFEVLEIFRRYVLDPKQIDDLIMVHKYTCDVWKNGAKHLYFYTLHNQEHAIDLIKNIIKIVKSISYLKISAYDYYLLFISSYLHDISMVRIASEDDFLLD